MSRIIAIKIKQADGTYSEEIPVSALAENIGWDEEHSLKDAIGPVKLDAERSLKAQIVTLAGNINSLQSNKASKTELSNLNTSIQNQLKGKVSTGTLQNYQISMNTVLGTKVSNSSFNSYKEEVDARFDNLVGATQIEELQAAIEQKANATDVTALGERVDACATAQDLSSHIESANQTANKLSQNIAKVKDVIGSFEEGTKISQKISAINSDLSNCAKKTDLTNVKNSLQTSIDAKASKTALDAKVNRADLDAIITQLIKENKSHVGQIIMSTTLDTQDKVIAEYGGKAWTRIQGRFLLGAGSATDGITSEVNDTGGSATHSHNYGVMAPSYYGTIISADAANLAAICVQDYNENNEYSWGSHNTVMQSATKAKSFPTKANIGLKNGSSDTTCSAIYSSGDTSYSTYCPPYYSCYIWKRTQ